MNDTLGHHAGDDLIRLAAQRLASAVRPLDTLARTGGDEFLVLVTDVEGEGTVIGVAERLIESMRAPFFVQGERLNISCSIGVAVAPGHRDHYESLVKRADSAMYEAKAKGRDTYAVHVARGSQSETLPSSVQVARGIEPAAILR